MLKRRARGFRLIELMIVVTIVAILTLVALPSVGDWLQNSKMRSVADSMANGLRLAQGEAVRLSRQTTFAPTSTGWTVSYVKITTDDSLPTVLQTSPAGQFQNVTITPGSGTPAVLAFNSLGRVLGASSATPPFTAIPGDVSYTITATGASRRMRLIVSPAGKVRMCDPDKSFSTSNPDGC